MEGNIRIPNKTRYFNKLNNIKKKLRRNMKNCDIIIPIYNAFDNLKKCIESLLLYTNFENNRLILIYDKSCDDRIITYIEDYISYRKQNIVLIKNEKNIGIKKTINIGIKYSNNDVLLLYSDTEATEGWFDKIQKCAYSKNNIATVTPLTNISTSVYIPEYCQTTITQNDFNSNNFQKYFDCISYKDYPEIPTGAGFCLYIKREILNIVEFPDVETEEILYCWDKVFCYRCLDNGYRNILCDDVIVFNKVSSQSDFYGNKIFFIEENILLCKKYPLYVNNTTDWIINSPLKYINKNININLFLNNGNSNILIIIHMWDEKYFSGTSFHVFDIIKELRYKYNFHVFVPDNNAYRLYSYWKNGEESIEIRIKELSIYSNSLFNLEYSNILDGIINFYKIDIIHIHHLYGHYFDIINVMKNKKTKLFISLHDYYAACPRINKYNFVYNRYCNNYDENECSFCLRYFSEKITNITVWINIWNTLFSLSNRIIVPSESTKREIKKTYNHIPVDVIEHGVNIKHIEEKLDIDNDDLFQIAFIGYLSEIKGKTIVEKLIKYASKFNDNIYFHLIGDSDSNFLQGKSHKKIICHGKYNRKDLGVLLRNNNIKLGCLFSIVPETYSYTLTECLANNIPVLVFDIGALGQRVNENNLGWLIKTGSTASEIYRVINDIFRDKKKYKEILNSVSAYKIKTVKEMGLDYDKIYSNYKVLRNSDDNNIERIRTFIKDTYLNNINFDIETREKYISYSWRIEKTVSWILRKIKSIFQCFLTYGLRFTIKLIIVKLKKNILII